MNDGANMGIGASRALDTILGGKAQPTEEDIQTPEWWMNHLESIDDSMTLSYDGCAKVMAKYILQAFKAQPELYYARINSVYMRPIDFNNPIILIPDMASILEQHFYPDDKHPFRRAYSEATGFMWGWAFNIARYAMGWPEQQNPALISIGDDKDE